MKKPDVVKEHPPEVARRLYWLERLIDTEYEGKASTFAAKTGVNMAQVGQWFSGYRFLRENALRTLAEKTGKPEEYFNQQPDIVLYSPSGEPAAIIEVKHRAAVDVDAEIDHSMRVIVEALARVDKFTKLQLEPLFSLLAKSDRESVLIAQRIAALLKGQGHRQESSDHQGKSPNQVDNFDMESDTDGTGDSTQESDPQTGRHRRPRGSTGKG